MRMSIKSIIAAMLLVTLSTICAYADWAFDDLRNAIEDGLTYEDLKALQNKYQRRIISGEGYIFMTRKAISINGCEVHILEKYDKSKLANLAQGDVCVIIPEGSPFSKTVEKLESGQKVSFSGKMDRIFGRTIYIRGSAKILLKL